VALNVLDNRGLKSPPQHSRLAIALFYRRNCSGSVLLTACIRGLTLIFVVLGKRSDRKIVRVFDDQLVPVLLGTKAHPRKLRGRGVVN